MYHKIDIDQKQKLCHILKDIFINKFSIIQHILYRLFYIVIARTCQYIVAGLFYYCRTTYLTLTTIYGSHC